MIKSFKHRGIRELYLGKTARRVAPQHLDKLRDILSVLDQSSIPDDMNLPGFKLHPLRGDRKGYWAISVSGNWRVTFRFEGGHVLDVDYDDYH